jgi:CRP-like cAMP-binding protein
LFTAAAALAAAGVGAAAGKRINWRVRTNADIPLFGSLTAVLSPCLATPLSGLREGFVAKKAKASFDPKKFLAKVGDGTTISKYHKKQIVFSQGDVADAVFYIQKGKVELTVISEQGKEAVIAILGPRDFLAKDA